ncbi:MAG: AAA family ATPase [Candidatus Dormibacteria bacterium]
MADVELLALVAARLEADPPPDGAGELVLAAFEGGNAIDATLRGEVIEATHVVGTASRQHAPAVYLSSLEVEGFRGIGDAATLAIDPGPGLTLVVGRNGSGKSSFSEALEMLLTGTNQRWKDRNLVWKDGWQNLHHRSTCISAQFTVDGHREPLTLRRRWAAGYGVDASSLEVDGKRTASLDGLGWTHPLAAYPPTLSHNELEHSLDDKQTALYDALAGILGLGDLAKSQQALRDARLGYEGSAKTAKSASEPLIQLLERTDDERAAFALTALKARRWDLDALRSTVSGAAAADEHSTLRRLQEIESVQAPDREELYAAVDELRDALAEADRMRGTDAAQADEIAGLLEQALTVHAHVDDQTCPVCSTENVLTYEWRMGAGTRIGELREVAAAARTSRRRATDALTRARRLIVAMPPALRDAGGTGVDVTEAVHVWERWLSAPGADEPSRLVTHLQTVGPQLIGVLASVRASASAERARRERSWRPAADAIMAWLPQALRARDEEAAMRRVKAAEQWLKDAHDSIRDERFQPIAGEVQRNWTELRQDSNVSLGALELTGSGNARRLRLDVRVDGEAGSALGVMSQGELNCLALSLFLPRASLPESPFHFVVIDDPVQAMDPAKVEGLARVLDRAARDRQVIVLTHDMRLADAVDYLGIRATRIEVVRGEGSVVDLRRVHDAVGRYIDDALAVALSPGLPPEAARVIPGFCRQALEAACARAITQRMLHEGKRYADVEAALAVPTTLKMWLALALLKDANRSSDVADYLRKHHAWAVDIVEDCNRATHGARLLRDMKAFVRSVEKLAGELAPEPAGA